MSNPYKKIDSVKISLNESSLITELEWSKNNKKSLDSNGELMITFKQNGERYWYKNVSADTLKEMLESDSIGKYFCANIKEQYDTYKEQ